MSDFGGLIRQARERLGLSPNRVAELIGRASGTVKAWERGRTVPRDPLVLRSLAAVLAIDEAALFRAAGLPPPGAAPVTTIEQELASIAPRHPAPQVADPLSPLRPVLADQPLPPSETRDTDEPEMDAIGAFLQKGKESLEQVFGPGRRRPERRARRERTPSAPTSSPLPVQSVVVPTGSYVEDEDERWAYRLRAIWTTAGVGALGVLLLWAGSRALAALGDAWNALLAGL
jgi:transcriptional regulator with XRE-family HTH domain